jgi:hypothetical protein
MIQPMLSALFSCSEVFLLRNLVKFACNFVPFVVVLLISKLMSIYSIIEVKIISSSEFQIREFLEL